MNLPTIQNRLGAIKHSIRSALDMVTDSKGKFSAIQDVGIDQKLVEDITNWPLGRKTQVLQPWDISFALAFFS